MRHLLKNSTKTFLIIFLFASCICFYEYRIYNIHRQLDVQKYFYNGIEISSVENDMLIAIHKMNSPIDDYVEPTLKTLTDSLFDTTKTLIATNATEILQADNQNNISSDKTEENISFESSKNNICTEQTTEAQAPPPPPLYIITPTYRRPEQLPEITRMGYTLKHVPNLMWLVIEDAENPTYLVTKFLNKLGIPFEHLVAPMPEEFRNSTAKPRGVASRNRGLNWLRENATDGVFYFGDDDNTYDIELFEQIRYTINVSMFPVGLVTKLGLSSPIIENGTFTRFYDGFIASRKFPVDMAGFAVSVNFLFQRPNATMPYKPGYEEDGFLKSLAPLETTDIELLASNCTEILVWHTQAKKNLPALELDMEKFNNTNIVELHKLLV